jgi:hypothetical protein
MVWRKYCTVTSMNVFTCVSEYCCLQWNFRFYVINTCEFEMGRHRIDEAESVVTDRLLEKWPSTTISVMGFQLMTRECSVFCQYNKLLDSSVSQSKLVGIATHGTSYRNTGRQNLPANQNVCDGRSVWLEMEPPINVLSVLFGASRDVCVCVRVCRCR